MKESVTMRLDAELLERLRNAAWWARRTVTDYFEDALPAIVRQAEEANGGKPFPPREGDLPLAKAKRKKGET